MLEREQRRILPASKAGLHCGRAPRRESPRFVHGSVRALPLRLRVQGTIPPSLVVDPGGAVPLVGSVNLVDIVYTWLARLLRRYRYGAS
jgi:hypothetical protein